MTTRAYGKPDVVEIANSMAVHGAARAAERPAPTGRLARLTDISPGAWRALAQRAIEPNGYWLADWALAVDAFAHGRTDVSTLSAWTAETFTRADQEQPRLFGLLPVISAWRAFRLPLPVLVSADPYGTLTTPLLDRDMAAEAAALLMQQARAAGARALVLRNVSLDRASMQAIREALARDGITPRVLQSHARACLDATQDADALLHDALGAKKLKELRRQRNRLAEHGDVAFTVAHTPSEIASAIDTFLTLEASGWKGKRGTALSQNAGDDAFIRQATRVLAEHGQCEIAMLHAGATAVAAAIIVRHLDRAFYFKIGIDERFAKYSPGVQLTLDVTRHLCADPGIASADSTAHPGHPMIDPIWRGRLAIGDVLVPLRANDPVVAIIHAALRLRQSSYALLRRAVHMLRARRG